MTPTKANTVLDETFDRAMDLKVQSRKEVGA
jgi:hypothetical protein